MGLRTPTGREDEVTLAAPDRMGLAPSHLGDGLGLDGSSKSSCNQPTAFGCTVREQHRTISRWL